MADKKCPFCSGSPRMVINYMGQGECSAKVMCTRCRAQTNTFVCTGVPNEKFVEEVWRKWNGRA